MPRCWRCSSEAEMPAETRRLTDALQDRRIHKRAVEFSARAVELYGRLGNLYFDPAARREVEIRLASRLEDFVGARVAPEADPDRHPQAGEVADGGLDHVRAAAGRVRGADAMAGGGRTGRRGLQALRGAPAPDPNRYGGTVSSDRARSLGGFGPAAARRGVLSRRMLIIRPYRSSHPELVERSRENESPQVSAVFESTVPFSCTPRHCCRLGPFAIPRQARDDRWLSDSGNHAVPWQRLNTR